jgi:hypothetical protein
MCAAVRIRAGCATELSHGPTTGSLSRVSLLTGLRPDTTKHYELQTRKTVAEVQALLRSVRGK